MKYEEETYAKELQHLFQITLSNDCILCEGAGVHWQCSVQRGERRVKVSCFSSAGPEYLASFYVGSNTLAWGRTHRVDELLESVQAWVDGHELPTLYARFAFVDADKRTLEHLRDAVVAYNPVLGQLDAWLEHQMCDVYMLHWRWKNRRCQIEFYGNERHPQSMFYWDDCELFRLAVSDIPLLASLLQRWLFDAVLPSTIANEFPTVTMDPVAQYYEAGTPIEGEFLVSWDRIETYFVDPNMPNAKAVLAFVQALRSHGFDRTLRAGQSLWTLVLSRSRRHGLRDNQPCVAFEFHNNRLRVRGYHLQSVKIDVPRIELTAEVLEHLRQLAAQPID